MKMTFDQLTRVAKNMLAVVRKEGLASLDALKARAGDVFDPASGDRHDGEEFVDVQNGPGGALILAYRRRTGQAPIMVIARPGRVKIMLTSEGPIAGYTAFDESEDGDVMQDRVLEGGCAGLERELESLTAARAEAPKAAGSVRDAGMSFELACAACGATAGRFQKGMYPGDDHLLYFNVKGEQRCMFSGSDSERMSAMLGKGDLAALHKHVETEAMPRAPIDAYCPACDAPYCAAHWTGKTCTKGHTRSG